MPSSEARRLTEAHRLAQARLGVGVVRQMLTIWPLLSPIDLDGTFARWLIAATAVVNAQRSASSVLAGGYVQMFRSIELDAPPMPIVTAPPAEVGRLATSLLVTGPVSVKANVSRGVSLDAALDLAASGSARSAMRFALDGGRDTITATAKRDNRAQGYRRVASGNACAYCSNLDGIEFATDDVFQPHDGCACSAEPIYR